MNSTLPKPSEKSSQRRSQHSIAETLRHLRQGNGFTLNELARRCDLAPSTLSKIENGQMSPTYDTILSLAEGLGVDVADLFSERQTTTVSGRRTVTRAGDGVPLDTAQYDYQMLCTDLANKQFVPLRARIKANSVSRFDGMLSHPGEEFVFVLSGEIELHTQFYAPTRLSVGDSCYFDSTMGHALIRASEEDAEVLWICSRVVEPLRG
ncbi:MAG TPA: XRE family transcriptional regulator [Pelagibacterium sp.]|uniref:helix-turn-helix domain-containing protein n=1 Tax=uncultured Pelagibacterium sp. TaxID=1159875 RepID=UPI000C40E949|nr:XRE family transcriptional regulator [Pelagibacterium sp.]HCO56373.1 XRE family transcriptional regulator [Pelagibacterium sp.]|tara:strand:+ start:24218 stop:24841 length:624 start_codon:yes stop_codon:yes gene_type:complete